MKKEFNIYRFLSKHIKSLSYGVRVALDKQKRPFVQHYVSGLRNDAPIALEGNPNSIVGAMIDILEKEKVENGQTK
jgi:hypothetical protein